MLCGQPPLPPPLPCPPQLPVPYAWSRAGVVPGALIAVATAAANAAACRWLASAAAATGHTAYEALAQDVGGRGKSKKGERHENDVAAPGGRGNNHHPLLFFSLPALALTTQASLALLLFGTVCGDIALFTDVAPTALGRLFPYADARGALPSGRLCATVLTLLVVTPLSFLRQMRSLETAAAAGVGVVVILVGAVAVSAVKADWPALHDGDLAVWTPTTLAALPEAAGVLGFAFYLCPVLFPLMAEMPPGRSSIAGKAAAAVTLTVAPLVYGALGVFGAARYGLYTQPSMLVNAWLGGGVGDGLLDAAAVAYLAVSVPPMMLSLRFTLASGLAGGGEGVDPGPRGRFVLTAAPLAAALAVAVAAPSGAEKIFAATGAAPVCIVCYVVPAVVRVAMLRRRAGGGQDAAADGDAEGGSAAPLLPAGRGPVPARLLVGPALVAALGVVTGVSNGWLAVRALVGGR